MQHKNKKGLEPCIIKPAKCCYNCMYFNMGISNLSMEGICTMPYNVATEYGGDVIVYPYETCNHFKKNNNKL